ncbi:MAG: anthranilate synthase component I family protein [Micrococcus sp.]|nr:anthranilate synthase component I family protein [Micrococcus sp.]
MNRPAGLVISTATLGATELRSAGHSSHSAALAVARYALDRGHGSFWLDSALTAPAGPHDDGARHSILGDAHGGAILSTPAVATPAEAEAAWERLREAAAPRPVHGGEDLPLRGGLVGFLSYELGVATLGLTPRMPRAGDPAAVPASYWVRPARWVVVDHQRGELVCCVASDAADHASADDAAPSPAESGPVTSPALDAWTATVREALRVPHGPANDADADRAGRTLEPAAEVAGTWREDRAAYTELIERCQAALHAGDSYELCLTTRFDVDPSVEVDALELFAALRSAHPAPYAALIEQNPGPAGEAGFAVVSASPERFLTGQAGQYSTKPIKGTAPRHPDPVQDARIAAELAADPKTRAENLMIVDLLRNDLSRVCVPGSVQVPALMAVESFASVHQLVSTVTGRARPGLSAVDVAHALFPGGSMTGAPKRRTVELLSQWEPAPRGVYSGTLGFFSADGDCGLSIVIRTAVRTAIAGQDSGSARYTWSIGAGGAIVADSDPDAEYDEVLLKAAALRRALNSVARR